MAELMSTKGKDKQRIISSLTMTTLDMQHIIGSLMLNLLPATERRLHHLQSAAGLKPPPPT